MAAGEVDRCVCMNATLAQMKAYSERHGGDFEALREHFGCGRGCALCVPYVRAMLATGRTSFAPGDPALHEASPPRPGAPPSL